MSEIWTDTRGNRCIDVFTGDGRTRVRLTISRPEGKKDWAGTGCYIRFNAYRADGSGPKPGAEWPLLGKIEDDECLCRTARFLRELHVTG